MTTFIYGAMLPGEPPEPGEPSYTLLGRDLNAAMALYHYADLLEQDIVNGHVSADEGRVRINHYRDLAKDMEAFARSVASKIRPEEQDDSTTL